MTYKTYSYYIIPRVAGSRRNSVASLHREISELSSSVGGPGVEFKDFIKQFWNFMGLHYNWDYFTIYMYIYIHIYILYADIHIWDIHMYIYIYIIIYYKYVLLSSHVWDLGIQTLSEGVLNPPNYSKLYPKRFLRRYGWIHRACSLSITSEVHELQP